MAEMIIGRSDEAAVLIDDGKVSRRHARLRFRNEIAGDFYDYLALDERLLAFFVAEIESPQGRLIGIETAGECFSEVTVHLEPSDALLLYTDGVTEAASEGSGLFGVERLLGCLGQLPDTGSLQGWAETIRQNVESHSASRQLQDDLTLLLLRRPEGPTPQR